MRLKVSWNWNKKGNHSTFYCVVSEYSNLHFHLNVRLEAFLLKDPALGSSNFSLRARNEKMIKKKKKMPEM